MATPLTRAEWLDECAKLAKTYEEAMTEEQIIRLYGKRCAEYCPECCVCEVWAMHDLIETQAREIERLRGALRNIRALATKRQNVWGPDGCLTDIECFAIAALAGDSHDQ